MPSLANISTSKFTTSMVVFERHDRSDNSYRAMIREGMFREAMGGDRYFSKQVAADKDSPFALLLGDGQLPSMRDAQVATSLIAWLDDASTGRSIMIGLQVLAQSQPGRDASDVFSAMWKNSLGSNAELYNRIIAPKFGLSDDPLPQASKRDQFVMDRVISWLGTPAGQAFMDDFNAEIAPALRQDLFVLPAQTLTPAKA